ncbi:MAG: hypothetical protein GTO02_03090 [Candidatus Dadabacteria bacterium]|nr:hypothetical protein [Candidatus Dadabacteria bacterium]NIQ13415.1 hypothetical protein [Candidatus Dadabacteria bacterium]
MRVEEIDKIIEMWSKYVLNGPLEDYKIDIESDVKEDFASIALYMDFKTCRASGEIEEYYEGYKQAAVDILSFIGIEISQDDNSKLIRITKSSLDLAAKEELLKNVWG